MEEYDILDLDNKSNLVMLTNIILLLIEWKKLKY